MLYSPNYFPHLKYHSQVASAAVNIAFRTSPKSIVNSSATTMSITILKNIIQLTSCSCFPSEFEEEVWCCLVDGFSTSLPLGHWSKAIQEGYYPIVTFNFDLLTHYNFIFIFENDFCSTLFLLYLHQATYPGDDADLFLLHIELLILDFLVTVSSAHHWTFWQQFVILFAGNYNGALVYPGILCSSLVSWLQILLSRLVWPISVCQKTALYCRYVEGGQSDPEQGNFILVYCSWW